MLLDSNIIIYAVSPDYDFLIDWMAQQDPRVSVISKLEVLGYHQLSPEQFTWFTHFFDQVPLLPISDTIIDSAVQLRQQRRVSLGDAIIAATALVYQETLVTRNVSDFQWVNGLNLLNPIDQGL